MAMFHRTLYTSDSSISTSVAATHTDFYNTQENLYSTVAVPGRAADAATKMLMYTNAIWVRPSDATGILLPVTYSTANPNESWFLHTVASGNPRAVSGTSPNQQYYMNVGNTAYQNACISHITAMFNNQGANSFDGLFIDGVSSNLVPGFGDFPGGSSCLEYSGGTSGTTYPTDWHTAMLSWLTNVCAGLKANGIPLIIVNTDVSFYWPSIAGDYTSPSSWWQAVNGKVDGAMEESWCDGGAGPSQNVTTNAGHVFINNLANATWSGANGKYFFGHSHRVLTGPTQTDEVAATYALGVTLLAVNADPASATNKVTLGLNGKTTTDQNVPWYPEYGTALALGGPSAPAAKNADGSYTRSFAHGIVTVNPTAVTQDFMAPFTANIVYNNPAPANTVPPAVTGTPVNGNTLTCDGGTWSGSPAPTLTYQWRSYNTDGTGGANIGGATASTYVVQVGDIGKKLGCTVTATNTSGNATAASPLTATAAAAPQVAPSNSVAPAITGLNLPGRVLNVSQGTWTGTPTPSFGYQWQTSTDGGSTWTPVAGATNTSYTIQLTDAGNQLRCQVTGTNAVSSATANSNVVSVVTSQLWLIPSGGNGLMAPAGNYTLAASDLGALVTTTSTITLPLRPVPGRRYSVKNFAAGITVTVSTGTAGKIDTGGIVNATTTTITTQGQALDFMIHPNATDWVIV